MNFSKLLFVQILFSVLIIDKGYAQVTVGAKEPPVKGALLQLKEDGSVWRNNTNASKGLLLPRVKLTETTKLKPMYSYLDAASTPSQKDLDDHAGLTVYAIEEFGYPLNCPGVYVWDRGSWQSCHSPKPKQPTFTDGEGNTYTYTRIENKYWMTQNVRSLTQQAKGSTYIDTSDGLRINPASRATEDAVIVKNSIPAGNITYQMMPMGATALETITLTNEDFVRRFGLLYTHTQATKACPEGWRLPTTADWDGLLIYLDPSGSWASNIAGKYLKSDNATYVAKDGISGGSPEPFVWGGYSTCKPENIGFNAIPAGAAKTLSGSSQNGRYGDAFSSNTYFWTASPNTLQLLWAGNDILYRFVEPEAATFRFSVRCVKDI